MLDVFALLIVLLGLVVLSALLVTSSRFSRSLELGMIGVFGVVLGGPSAVVVVTANADEASSNDTTQTGDIVPFEVIEIAPQENFEQRSSRDSADHRPAWVDEPAIRSGSVHRTVVSSGPHVDLRASHKALNEQLEIATAQYVRWYIGHDAARRLIDFDLDTIHQRLRNPKYQHSDSREFLVGRRTRAQMFTCYAMLEFDEGFRHELDERWRKEVSRSRMLFTALIGGALFALLVVVFCYFRLDTGTRGYYTHRLQFLTIGAVLAILTASVLAVKWTGIVWLW